MFNQCVTGSEDRRRVFWTTQANGCGTEEDECGQDCARPGLRLLCGPGNAGATIANNDYAIGLALNILLTDGKKPDTRCGYAPGNRGGFWGDSFREDNLGSGSQIRNVSPRKSIFETMALIKAFAVADLKKLVTYGVAVAVDVDLLYVGDNRLNMTITVTGQAGVQSRVGLTGQRIKNSWVWSK